MAELDEAEELTGELVRFRRKKERGHPAERNDQIALPDPPWERAAGEGETTRQYARFAVYRDLGPERLLRDVSERFGVKHGEIMRVSSRFRWRERAEAWDDENERQLRMRQKRALSDMAERHAQICVALQTKAVQKLQQIDPMTLDAKDISRFIDVAIRNERLARGEPSEITAGEQKIAARVMTDAELEAFERGG